jgi:dihydrofolate reductase
VPKTILYIAISLDGYIAGKDDDLSWLGPFQDVDYDYEAFFSKIGAIIREEGPRT